MVVVEQRAGDDLPVANGDGMRQLRPHPWDPTGGDSGVLWCTGAPALGLLCALGEQLVSTPPCGDGKLPCL